MINYVRSFCKSCPVCQSRKKTSYTGKVPLGTLPEACRPFQRISVDLITKLPLTDSGMRHILVAVCHFSRFLIAVPLPDQTANTVAKALVKHVFLQYGVPQSLLSDRGANFVEK